MANAGRKMAVYRIDNVDSGRFYIGSSSNVYDRWRAHRQKLRKSTHPNTIMQASWNKNGEGAFKFTIVAEFESVADMEACEQELINAHWDDPQFMNLAKWVGSPMRGRTGADHPNHGKPISDAQKKALSAATLKQWEGSDPRTGRTHSDKTKAEISAKVQSALSEGRGGKFIPTEETRVKMSEALKGNQNAKGHVRSAQHRKKLSEANLGNQNWLGRSHSEESRVKMGRAVIARSPDGEDTTYATITLLREAFDMSPPTVNRALKSGKPVTKGRMSGWTFLYT